MSVSGSLMKVLTNCHLRNFERNVYHYDRSVVGGLIYPGAYIIVLDVMRNLPDGIPVVVCLGPDGSIGLLYERSMYPCTYDDSNTKIVVCAHAPTRVVRS